MFEKEIETDLFFDDSFCESLSLRRHNLKFMTVSLGKALLHLDCSLTATYVEFNPFWLGL